MFTLQLYIIHLLVQLNIFSYVVLNEICNHFVSDLRNYGSLFVPHKRKILCRYNDLYVVITTSVGSRYNDILSRYNDILSRYNDLQWMSL